MADPPVRPTRPRQRLLVLAALAAVGAATLFGLVRTARAVQAGREGRAALVRAESELRRRAVDPARRHLERAERSFARMERELDGLGPLGLVGRITPFVRVQLRGAEVLAGVGVDLSRAGLVLTDAATDILDSGEDEKPLSSALDALQRAHEAVRVGAGQVDTVVQRVGGLDGYRLVGPLGDAYDDLRARLPDVQRRVASAEQGLGALVTFVGGDGPRRYLVLTQNPDEPRPTGGYIGTYGVLDATDGELRLERFDDIGPWIFARKHVWVPAAEAPSLFRFGVAGEGQSLANVNAVPDWEVAAKLAMDMWVRGGEQPVHGVVSMLPAFMARVVRVTGPVRVPEYNEVVRADNLVERMDFYAHNPDDPSAPGRKQFVASLAHAVLEKVLATPSERWGDLAEAVGNAFDAREAMVYSTDPGVQAAVADRRWDGRLPQTFGDFFYNAEFSYQAKNGRSLKRTFDHHVEVRPDGSARITTKITISNAEPPDREFNRDSLSYIIVYGPAGATLDPESDLPAAQEPPVAGHPAAGWFRAAPPGGETTITVVWNAPSVVADVDGGRAYGLWWMKLPDHTGDVLNLRVDLPPGWSWRDQGPPAQVPLERDFVGTWAIATSG
jgi:hypothetical protein